MPSAHTGGVVERALGSLAAQQSEEGEFKSFLFRNAECRGEGSLDSTPFATASIEYALSFCPSPAAQAMRVRARAFLRNTMLPGGLWRYWTSRSGKIISPDLDDTACISRALMDTGDQAFPVLNRSAFLAQRNQQGLFFTWFHKSADVNDVDSVVNANVIWYLGESGETRLACEYLCALVKRCEESSSFWYYLDTHALYYAISRAARQSVPSFNRMRTSICERITAWANRVPPVLASHSAALALCSLLNFNWPDESILELLVTYLVQNQRANGSWPVTSYYAGPEPPSPHRVWFGSEAVTTALCLEGIVRFQRQINPGR